MDLELQVFCLLLNLFATGWPHRDTCPSSKWNVMCRPCCEYYLIQCRCPSKRSRVGYTVPCCRNAVEECDPCIIHPGCSLFENCKTCNNGTWRANDDFFVDGKYCTECRQGWSGGDCRICGGVIRRAQGHVVLESYPTNARCEWTLRVGMENSVELRFSLLSLETDYNCRHDYVEVRDGDDLGSPVIGRFCGDQLPPPIKSSGNSLHILFSSDGYNNFDGFVFTFQENSEHFSTVSTITTTACSLPGKPTNGYSEPVYGPEKELLFVNYWCHAPFILSGAQQRTCLPNGTWSGTIPSCVKGQTRPVQCAPAPKLLHGFHKRAHDPAGGGRTIEFFCKNSYVLRGSHQSSCLSNGTWSSRPPKCVRACREPKVSGLVRQSVVKPRLLSRYNMRDMLSAGFIPLLPDREGRHDEDASFPPGFHPLYTSMEYRCASSLHRHTGSSRRTCLQSGRWSGRHVSCSPVCGKLDSFSRHNLSDTQWPWHVAIYIRSASSQRRSALGQQGAPEDSWYLACSAALVAQRSVLAAAHCVVDKDKQQPLHPAHVKVVVGMQYPGSRNQMKRLQHLRVSDIVIHPNFYPGSDSDVALLKLKDKAKISERLLPVCLPAVQGGEVVAQEAYTARWTVSVGHGRQYAASAETRLVELGDVAQCEREFARGGVRTAVISDNTLCVVSEPSGPGSPRAGGTTGATTTLPAVPPSSTGGLSVLEGTLGDSSAAWQLLGLESFICRSSNQQTYTVHTKIANFRDWIEENMR